MFLRSFILVFFSSVTLLGSAGMHTVSEWLGTCSHHHGHVHSHEQCCSHDHSDHDHHGHSHAQHVPHDEVAGVTESSSESSAPENQSHQHDSENCVVCIHYSLLAESASYVELPSLISVVDQSPLPAYEEWVVNTTDTFDRRGPPAAA